MHGKDEPTARAVVPAALDGERFDFAAARLFTEFSRARLTQWIREGLLTCNDRSQRPRDPVHEGNQLCLYARVTESGRWDAEAGRLNLVYVDDDLIVLDKPADLVVHPAPGHPGGTLVNLLLHHFPELNGLPRAGVVHRLDKDTSGIMVVARSLRAHHSLVEQLQTRSMGREYEALVYGEPVSGGMIDAPLGRHPQQRLKRAVVGNGKPARTEYRILERLSGLTLLRMKLFSGRTHQIRVHLAHIGLPIVGDPLYGQGARVPKGLSSVQRALLSAFPRQALHACHLHLLHPAPREEKAFEVPAAGDIVQLMAGIQSSGESA